MQGEFLFNYLNVYMYYLFMYTDMFYKLFLTAQYFWTCIEMCSHMLLKNYDNKTKNQ
jgi:hypothetical protein